MTAAKPEVTRGRKFTAIWIVPLVAVALGIWMVIYTYLNEGPEIRITFQTAVGLEAGKTKVKFRNVDIGQVLNVSLSEDMQSTVATVKLEREARALLGDDSRFWIVTARIGGGSISHLDTLLTGAYIAISPATERSKKRDFVALEQPPLTPIGAPGLRITLISKHSVSVSSGDPVLYRGFKVGRVESMELVPQSDLIKYSVFIDAPYHKLIHSSVRFWDISGIQLSADADGVELSTGSIESLLLGGVTFGTVPDLPPGSPIENNAEFNLFPSYKAVLESPHRKRLYYVAEFDQSVRGLLPGAPVEFRGVLLGRVDRILVKEVMAKHLNQEIGAPNVPVLFHIEPGRLEMPDTTASLEKLHGRFAGAIKGGLRATLKTGNLLSGAKIVSLDYYKDPSPAGLGEFEGYPTLPTIGTGLLHIEQQVTKLLDKINGLPIEDTVSSLNLAIAELTRSMESMRNLLENDSMRAVPGELEASLRAMRELLEADSTRAVPDELQASLLSLRTILDDESTQRLAAELEATLASARDHLQGTSPETYQLGLTLKEVESAARALREFLDFLEQNPEGLLQGKSGLDK